MSEAVPAFVFRIRPKPCAGDLRISWRLSVTLLALLYSRGSKASFAKLHVLNDALRSEASKQMLLSILEKTTPLLFWRLRVEPAFSRALDYLVGEGFANWTVSDGKTSLVLTPAGIEAAEAVDRKKEVLSQEREFLKTAGRLVTEKFVQSLLAAGKKLL